DVAACTGDHGDFACKLFGHLSPFVMPGLVPGIHVLLSYTLNKAWMAGPSPRRSDFGRAGGTIPAMTILVSQHAQIDTGTIEPRHQLQRSVTLRSGPSAVIGVQQEL